MGVTPDQRNLPPGLRRLFGRQEVGNTIHDGVVDVALGTVERAGNYFCAVFFFYAQLKVSLAHGAGEDIHQFLFHSPDYITNRRP